jgi:DNA helicase IV
LNHEAFISLDTDVIVIVYVNDLLLFESDMKEIRHVQNELSARFQMTDLKELFHYLEMKIIISLNCDVIFLKQRTYMKKILTQFEMIDFNLVSISMKAAVTNSLISID